jgi:hypothetical protein
MFNRVRRFFGKPIRPGDPVSRSGIAKGLSDIDYALSNIGATNGAFWTWSHGIPYLNLAAVTGDSALTSSNIRFGWAGTYYDEALNKNFVRIYKGAIQIENDTYTLPVDEVSPGDDPVNYLTDEIVIDADYIIIYAGAEVTEGEDGSAFIDAEPIAEEEPDHLPAMWTGNVIRVPLYTLAKSTVSPPEDAAEGYLTTRWSLHRIHNLGDIKFSGSGGGFSIRGTQEPLMSVTARAYLTSDDSIVDADVEYNPATMYLHPTWDWVRQP